MSFFNIVSVLKSLCWTYIMIMYVAWTVKKELRQNVSFPFHSKITLCMRCFHVKCAHIGMYLFCSLKKTEMHCCTRVLLWKTHADTLSVFICEFCTWILNEVETQVNLRPLVSLKLATDEQAPRHCSSMSALPALRKSHGHNHFQPVISHFAMSHLSQMPHRSETAERLRIVEFPHKLHTCACVNVVLLTDKIK